MGLFGRRKPVHQQLAEAGGLTLEPDVAPRLATAAQPPGWDGRQRGEPGIHGVPRARRWDTVATVRAELPGDEVHFTALPDRTLLVEEDVPDDSLGPLADAIEASLAPPYRAEAVRQEGDTWAVGARRIAVVEQRGLRGDEAELVLRGGERALTVDGEPRAGRTEALEAAGERAGAEYVVRATRLDGALWEIEATPL